MDRFDIYIEDVLSGKEITGKFIKQAVQRHLNDLNNDELLFDRDFAQIVVDFCEMCRHWKGTMSEQRITLENWQVFYVASIFGWRNKNGLRRFRESYLEIARKNGKTTLLALIILVHLIFDNEQGSQVLCGSNSEEQSRLVVNDVGKIILATPELKKLFKLRYYDEKVTRVIYPNTASFVEPLPKIDNRLDGKDPSMGTIDEFHEAPTTKILDVIKSGMQSRRQPLINIATTAGFNKGLPCYSVKRSTGIKILDGTLKDDASFVLIFSLDDGDDWNDKTLWKKPNPNLNVSVLLKNLEEDYVKAKNESGRTEVNFKTKNLNMWTDAAEVWIPDEMWMKNTGHLSDHNVLKGQICFGGLDLAKSYDINAFCLIFPYFSESFIPVLFWFWIPEEKAKTVEEFDYMTWVKQGYITATSGNICDPQLIASNVMDILQGYQCKGIAFDRYIALHGAIQMMLNAEISCNSLSQTTVVLSEPTKKMEELSIQNRFEHFNNPVMRWMVGNVELMTDSGGNIKPDKGKSVNKIDGVSALVNAIAQWLIFENGEMEANKKKISIYENKEMLLL